VSESAKPGGYRHPEDGAESVVRAKYLDYCSARVAEVILRLSADEIYVLAQEAPRDAEMDDTENLSYDRIVRLATERLSQQLGLPPFEVWSAAYREDPTRFEGELLGLWESDLKASESTPGQE
jgi:hypothetical protein